MSKYKIEIKEVTSMNSVTPVVFEEKASGEAKALAYVKARKACALLEDGEYVCSLLVKQFIIPSYKRDELLPDFVVKVQGGIATLNDRKFLFGGERAAIEKLASCTQTQNRLAAGMISQKTKDLHDIFQTSIREIDNAIDSLSNTYHPKYLSSNQYNNLKSEISKAENMESAAFQAYGSSPMDGIYSSSAAAAHSEVVTHVVATFTQIFNLL